MDRTLQGFVYKHMNNNKADMQEEKHENNEARTVAHIAIIGSGRTIDKRARTLIELSAELRSLEYMYYEKGYNEIDVKRLTNSLKDEFNIERDYKLELEDLLDLVKSLKESDGETLNVIIDSSGVVNKPKTGLICNIEDLKFETGTNREYRRNPLRAIAKSEGMDLIDYRPWDRTKHGSLRGKHNNNYYLNNKKHRRR